MSVMSVLCVNMVTANMLLSLFFVLGALAACPQNSGLFITAPKKMEALSGSCLLIPCNFRPNPEQEFDSEREAFGVWIKSDSRIVDNPDNVILNSSGTVNTYPMSIIGNLNQKNCTTLFSSLIPNYTNAYFLRIENWPFRATAFCDPLQITVKDSPRRPRIEISGDLKEKESVTITCSAFTPCPHSPPKLTWNLQQDSHNKIEENTDGTFTTKIQETITLSDQHDGYNISCSATYPVNEGQAVKTAEKTKTLSVSYSPRDTSVVISSTDPVSVGSVVNLTCSCRGNPPIVHFVWFMLSDGRLELIRVDTQVYGFEVTNSDRGRLFYCGCRNDLDILLSTGLQLTFKGGQQSGLVGVQVVVKLLGIITLVSVLVIFECWFRSRHSTKPLEDTVESDYVNTVTQSSSGNRRLTSVMVFTNPGSKFLCVNMVTANMLLCVLFISGALAACTRSSALSITAPKYMEALSGSCLQIPCNFRPKPEQRIDSSRETFGVWIKRDSRFEQDRSNVIFNSSRPAYMYPMNITGNLRERNCTTLFSSLLTKYTDNYFFRIENEAFTATASCDPLHITVKDSPRRPRIEISGDLKEKESVTITCSAFTPCPHSPPKLTWNLQRDAHNKIEENTDGNFTTQIQETITLSDQHDGYNISCSATYPVNEGQDVKTAEETKTLSVSYAPKNTSVSISASAGSWVNLTCSSRAKPPVSSFTWFRNSKDGPMNVSEGHFYSFNVTDGGDYYCVATNNLGSQRSPEIHPTNKEAQHGAVVGGVIGIIVVICAVVAIWWLKSKHPTSQQAQSLTAEEPAVRQPARATDKEDIHYAEIDFTNRPEPSSNLDVLYAQVQVSKTPNSLTQTADCPETVYAQVRKK
ncbi:B-cell receptor CD22-like [Pagrus major]|uniref:B-cell receptor CD22-like n=1 Tax=Pagrus major TaxID=143350 RepID=UPI003CC8CA43